MVSDAFEEFGPYLVYERLGQGGMATVHRAEKRGVGIRRPIALKRLLPHVAADPALVKLFVDEARLASHLHHANLAQTYDLGKVGDVFFIAMEFASGPTLAQIIRQCIAAAGDIPVAMTVNMLAQVCDALDYAHNLCDQTGKPLRIIHRDVSPANIVVTNTGVVKLIDFGIAKATISSTVTQTGFIKGKFGYIAPEYIVGKIDSRVDLFALGVVAHEMLAGRRLFEGKDDFETLHNVREMKIQPPSRWNPQVPPDLDDIVMTALKRNPEQRWQTAGALQVALANVGRELGQLVGCQQLAEWVAWAFSQVPADSGRIISPTTGDSDATVARDRDPDSSLSIQISRNSSSALDEPAVSSPPRPMVPQRLIAASPPPRVAAALAQPRAKRATAKPPEPVRSEPRRGEPLRAERLPETLRAALASRSEPMRSGSGRPESGRPESGRPESGRSERLPAEPMRTARASRSERAHAEPMRTALAARPILGAQPRLPSESDDTMPRERIGSDLEVVTPAPELAPPPPPMLPVAMAPTLLAPPPRPPAGTPGRAAPPPIPTAPSAAPPPVPPTASLARASRIHDAVAEPPSMPPALTSFAPPPPPPTPRATRQQAVAVPPSSHAPPSPAVPPSSRHAVQPARRLDGLGPPPSSVASSRELEVLPRPPPRLMVPTREPAGPPGTMPAPPSIEPAPGTRRARPKSTQKTRPQARPTGSRRAVAPPAPRGRRYLMWLVPLLIVLGAAAMAAAYYWPELLP